MPMDMVYTEVLERTLFKLHSDTDRRLLTQKNALDLVLFGKSNILKYSSF